MLKPKVGDVVRLRPVRVTDARRTDGGFSVTSPDGNRWFVAYAEDIEEILSRPLAVGDRVRHTASCIDGTLLGVDGEDAWVRTDPTRAIGVKLKNLVRADDAP